MSPSGSDGRAMNGACGHEWCLGAKRSICAHAVAHSLYPAYRVSLEAEVDLATILSSTAFTDLAQARLMSATHRQAFKLILPQFPGQTAAQRILDGSTTEQITSDRAPEATEGCLPCREPTLKAKKSHSQYPGLQWGFKMMLTGKWNSSETFK